MLKCKLKFTVVLFGAILVLGACVTKEPYVHNAGEFNRDSPNFAQGIKDRSSVEICYNKKSTTPAKILAVADIECAKFGKRAVFKRHNTLTCSIAAPAQAVFYCLASGEKPGPITPNK